MHTAIVSLLAIALCLATGTPRAEAHTKKFKITGGGYAPDGLPLIPYTPGMHTVAGNATELGKYTGEGFFQLLDYTGQLSAEFSSAPNCLFIGANGDQLAMTYGVVANGAKQPGQLTLVPNNDGSFTAYFVAEFNPDVANCTGKFEDVTGGSIIMYAVSDPFFILGTTTTPFNYTWHGEGKIEFSDD
jgi:hypothetical protein